MIAKLNKNKAETLLKLYNENEQINEIKKQLEEIIESSIEKDDQQLYTVLIGKKTDDIKNVIGYMNVDNHIVPVFDEAKFGSVIQNSNNPMGNPAVEYYSEAFKSRERFSEISIDINNNTLIAMYSSLVVFFKNSIEKNNKLINEIEQGC